MDQVTQIREKTDIVALISEFVTLKKSGRNFTGLCPFHNEKSPSFVVSPERQIWHCFGCSRGGDCYSFLIEYENIEFVEALQILAKRAGVELIREKMDGGVSSKKERLYKLNRVASEYYHYVLINHPAGKNALSYLLEKRKLTDALINTFMLGFAPANGRGLSSYLLSKKKYQKEDLLDSGLVIERGGRIIDFFRGRLMFPLFDHRGNVVGFSGRSLTENLKDGPKYINTRETLIYSKGSHFFGINTAKEEMRQTKRAIVVEGEFDAISCFKEGIGNAVASKGTALTEAQIQFLSRYVAKVSLCLDQDSAGQDAMFRSLPLLEKKGITTTVVVITEGKDPDEAIQKNSYAFKKAVKEDIPVYDFAINRALVLYDKKTAEGKRAISNMLLPVFAKIENEIVKEHYIKLISTTLETTYESITREMDRVGKPTIEKQIKTIAKAKRTRGEMLEEYLFALILQYVHPKEGLDVASAILSDFTFVAPVYRRILEGLIRYFKDHSEYDANMFTSTLPEELVSAFNGCYLFPLPPFNTNAKHLQEITRVSTDLKEIYIRSKIQNLADAIKKQEEENAETDLLKQEQAVLISRLQEKRTIL